MKYCLADSADYFRVPRPRQSPLPQHAVDGGRRAAPSLIEGLEVLRIAAREHHLPKAVTVRASHSAVLHKPIVRIIVEHFAPQVGIIAGRITFRPDVQEV